MPRGAMLWLVLTLMLTSTGVGAVAAPTEPANEQRIPFKRSEDTASGTVIRVLGGLAIAVLVGVGAVYLLKRYLPTTYRPGFTGSTHIKIVEARRLTPKTTLFLIEVEGVRLLVSQNGDRLASLSTNRAINTDHPYAQK